MEAVLNTANKRKNLHTETATQGSILEISVEEVTTQLDKMKSKKATGPDEQL